MADIGDIAKFCAAPGNVEWIEVHLFHQWAIQMEELKLNYQLSKTEAPSKKVI
jgi:hypothetical protein